MFKNFKKRATTVFRKKKAPDTPTDLPPEYRSVDASTSSTTRSDPNPPFRYTYSTSTNETDPRDYSAVPPPAPPAPPAPPSPPAPPEPALTRAESSHREEENPAEEPVTTDEATPVADPYARKYVPFVEATPLRNNMLVTSGVYGRVNPDIMGGFGDDSDDDIWLVDDEESDEELGEIPPEDEAPRETLALTPNQDHSDDRSETRSHRSTRSRQSRKSNVSNQEVVIMFAPSTSQDQIPDAPAPPSARPAFTYNRPSLLDDDEFSSFSLTTTTTVETAPRPPTPTVVPRRGYAPLSAAILNLADLGVDEFEDPPAQSPKPRTETARPAPPAASSSSVNPSSENPPVPVSVMPGTF